jgi:hypothetical protein
MNLATWKSIKSPVMQEIRQALKKKTGPGEPTLSRFEANRTWREEILGILSEDQKKAQKVKRQESNSRKKKKRIKEIEEE